MLALVNGEPKVLPLKAILSEYIKFQEEVITRRVKFDLAKALHEEHIFEGYKIAIDNIEEVIKIIRSSADVAESRENLKNRFALSDEQAQAIVSMTLGRLSGMERDKVEARLADLKKQIEEYRAILADEPTGSLDPEMTDEVIHLLQHAAHQLGKCVIVVTHSKRVADSADVVLRLRSKKLTRA